MKPTQPGSRQPSVARQLSRPLLVYDGDCSFCRYWVSSWRRAVGDSVDYAPSQQVSTEFPEIPAQAWAGSVQLILPEGQVLSGAEAVFRALAYAPHKRWMLWAYEHIPGFSPLSEWSYRLIAAHRPFFSTLTRLLWGRQPQPVSHLLAIWLFTRLLGVVYFVAFLSFWTQVKGLIGAHGILPAQSLLAAVSRQMGSERYRLFPTLAWLDSSDGFLSFLAGGGTLLSLLVVLGICTGPVLVVLWTSYLSLITVGRDFMSFQWDILLLEAGFLAIFLTPWRFLEPPWKGTASPRSQPSTAVLWLLRWLLFRLAFLSGAVKLLSGEPTWRNLTALDYHYWTQPLPTPVAWYAAQLPEWFQKLSVAGVFMLELAVPFLIFGPRRFRFTAAGLICFLQVLIALTGNYCFFNLLTVVLCITLLDDGFLHRVLPELLAQRIIPSTEPGGPRRFRRLVAAVLAVLILSTSVAEMARRFGEGQYVPKPVRELRDWVEPFYLTNTYGLFAVMTTSRLEIIVEGSQDGETWLPYEFRYKPGELSRRPPWVEPFQPRLDWQMWFAALGSYRNNPWFVNFMVRLLEGSPEVLGLLEKNPFPLAPPRYIRALAYDYHFTDFSARRTTGDWWRREPRGMYFPVVSLKRP